MKTNNFKKVSVIILVAIIIVSLVGLNAALAATSPTLVASTNYSVLGAETVTNTGATTTVGEVGVSAGSAITGFLPGVAAGSNAIHLHRNDASAIAAQADNLTAFGALAVDACGDGNVVGDGSDGTVKGINWTGTGSIDLSGKTLVPGIYCADKFIMTTGTALTLNGTLASDVWIFRATDAAASLVTTPGVNAKVVFTAGSASACNVWWKVASSATIGTGTDFIGNILALTSISLGTGANLVGRAFAQTGAVTLDTNIITGCATPLVSSNLTLDKIVVGGSASESDWTLTATGPMTLSGPGASGSTDVVGNVTIGTYDLSESAGPSNYNASTWSCTLNGGSAVVGDSIVLTANDEAVCTITNTYHAPSSGSMPTYGCTDPNATNYSSFVASNPALCTYASISTVIVPQTPIIVIPTPTVVIPQLPRTGFPPREENNSWYNLLFSKFINLFR